MGNFADPNSIPLWLKLGYTVFVAILVPVYWRYYGAGNFLWFSDLALFITLAAVWLESSLLASTLSVGLLELVWLDPETKKLRLRLVGGSRRSAFG